MLKSPVIQLFCRKPGKILVLLEATQDVIRKVHCVLSLIKIFPETPIRLGVTLSKSCFLDDAKKNKKRITVSRSTRKFFYRELNRAFLRPQLKNSNLLRRVKSPLKTARKVLPNNLLIVNLIHCHPEKRSNHD